MKTEWDPQAKKALRQIAQYIQRRFGTKARKSFLEEVKKTDNLLRSNPQLGAVDPLFAERQHSYRSVIINNLSKMVYFIDRETIYITAFWDTRKEPKAQARKVK